MHRCTRSIVSAAIFTGVALATAASPAGAAPAGFGGHFYEFRSVADPFTGNNNAWDTANAAALASTFNGESGYLATIGSQGENDFLLSLASGLYGGFAGAWLGGKSPEGWLTGPEAGQGFGYENWNPGEPNNNGYAYMIIGNDARFTTGMWADDSFTQGVPDPAADPVVGYFVEYNSPVPVPAAWLLFAPALAGLVRCSRRA